DQKIVFAPDDDFVNNVGQILITQEFPCGSPSQNVLKQCSGNPAPSTGLYFVKWNGTSFDVTPVPFASTSSLKSIGQWEHVTITCTYGTLTAGQSKTITLSAVTTTTTCATINNSATVSSSNDSNSSNNSAGPVTINVTGASCTGTPRVSIKKYTNGADAQTPN